MSVIKLSNLNNIENRFYNFCIDYFNDQGQQKTIVHPLLKTGKPLQIFHSYMMNNLTALIWMITISYCLARKKRWQIKAVSQNSNQIFIEKNEEEVFCKVIEYQSEKKYNYCYKPCSLYYNILNISIMGEDFTCYSGSQDLINELWFYLFYISDLPLDKNVFYRSIYQLIELNFYNSTSSENNWENIIRLIYLCAFLFRERNKGKTSQANKTFNIWVLENVYIFNFNGRSTFYDEQNCFPPAYKNGYLCEGLINQTMQKKPVTFLNLPEYPGGKEQFKKFVKEHLRYPKEAIEKKIEGLVLLSAEVNSKGEVSNIKVEKGIGYGCDEEAVRILGLMRFGGVKNRGVKVKTTKRFRINFKLPPAKPARKISYTVKKQEKQSNKSQPASYSYTIIINQGN